MCGCRGGGGVGTALRGMMVYGGLPGVKVRSREVIVHADVEHDGHGGVEDKGHGRV